MLPDLNLVRYFWRWSFDASHDHFSSKTVFRWIPENPAHVALVALQYMLDLLLKPDFHFVEVCSRCKNVLLGPKHHLQCTVCWHMTACWNATYFRSLLLNILFQKMPWDVIVSPQWPLIQGTNSCCTTLLNSSMLLIRPDLAYEIYSFKWKLLKTPRDNAPISSNTLKSTVPFCTKLV